MTNWVKTSDRLPPKGYRTMIIYDGGNSDNLLFLPANYDEGLYDLDVGFQCRIKEEFRRNITHWVEYDNKFWTGTEENLPEKEGIYGVTIKKDLSESPLGIAMGFGKFTHDKKWTSVRNNVHKDVICWIDLPHEVIKVLEDPKND